MKIVIRFFVSILALLLPVFGALFGYVISAFLRLGDRRRFWVVNGGAIFVAPTVVFSYNGFYLGPAGFVLLRGLQTGHWLGEVGLPLMSMVLLTFVNIRIFKYLRN